jgi:bifunctional non-homologous end joining protein LigD
MALGEYKRKRNFRKTPEPSPSRPAARKRELSYLIQKHDATRLHYDLRLELEGVLLSWAVTKGPSVNPADKRLAVRTEDHPLSYGSFEGTIPKGQYGGGTVMLWDQGTWDPEGDPHAGLKKGHLAFTLHGKRLAGGWDLIRMRDGGKRENWLLIKRNDSEARHDDGAEQFLDEHTSSVASDRSMDDIASGLKRKSQKSGSGLTELMRRYPEVQLATLTDRPPAGDEWVHEIKFDGYRLLGFLSGGQARLRTRNGKDWSEKFAGILAAMEELKAKDAVLDMEAVVVDEQGKSSFQGLQAALGAGRKASDEIIGYVFDLLHLDGKDVTKLPLLKRKSALKSLLTTSKRTSALRYSDHIAGDGGEIFEKSCGMGLEGIISKKAGAPYITGRHKGWLKSKCGKRQEFIIVGYSLAHSGGRAMGALYLGYRQNGTLRYVGKVGTGFSMKGARDLVKKFDALSNEKPVFKASEMAIVGAGEWRAIRWVQPELLAEVTFSEWTGDGHLRHPSFQGLREDKDAGDVKKETPVPVKSAANSALTLNGIEVTHPDRVISKTGNVTKGELAEYYSAVAPFLLPEISRRPLSLLRCPAGIDSQCFYQRNPGKGLGPDVHPFEFKHKGKTYEYLYIDGEKGLMELVQMGTIEIHPWGARIDSIDHPDKLIFDLDPGPKVPFEALKLAVQDLRERLKEQGLESTLKCSGGKGLHVIVPLSGEATWSEAKAFAASMARNMVKSAPEAYVATMTKAKRPGKIFIDYFRNDYTATAIADYAVRARPGAPVAVPVDWKELKTLSASNQFTMSDVLSRLKRKKPSPLPKGQAVPVYAAR